MALKKELEDKIAAISNEEYRNQMRKILEENEPLAKGWLGEAEVNRRLDQVAADKKRLDTWWANNEPVIQNQKTKITQLETSQAEWDSAKTQYEARVKELESKVVSGDYTPSEDRAMIQEMQGLKSTLEAIKTGMGSYIKQTDVETYVQKRIQEEGQKLVNFMSDDFYEANRAMKRYEKDFGKDLSKDELNELYGFAAKNSITSLERAYNEKYGDELRTKEIERIQSEADRRAEEKYKSVAAVPASPGPSFEPGPLAKRLSGNGDGAQSFASTDDAAAAAIAHLQTQKVGGA